MSHLNRAIFAYFLEKGARTFIDTTMFHGDGIAMAIDCGFEKVIGIEAADQFYQKCLAKFSDQIESGLVHLLYGDSKDEMENACNMVTSPAIYWLDTYLKEAASSFDESNYPLNAEIRTLIHQGDQNDIIMINNLHLLQDPGSWIGHDVLINKAIGALHRAFPNHVASLLDGNVARDIYALFPSHLAQEFFAIFPDALLIDPREKSVTISADVEKLPTLAVSAGGHNSRLGNMLPLYMRLRLACAQIKRTLSFPFAENVISEVFTFSDIPDDADRKSRTVLYSRMLRSAEEVVEAQQSVGPHAYARDQIYQVPYAPLDLKVVFGRGAIDWAEVIANRTFNTPHNILLGDPFPFQFADLTLDDLFIHAESYLSPRKDVFDRALTSRKSVCPPGTIDMCLHIRQSDYKQWRGGIMWYDEALISQIVDRIGDFMRMNPAHLTILSEDPLPGAMMKHKGFIFQSRSVPEDFARMAVADVVLSNSSTFSQQASMVGKFFLKNGNRYRSLGPGPKALDQLSDILSKLYSSPHQEAGLAEYRAN